MRRKVIEMQTTVIAPDLANVSVGPSHAMLKLQRTMELAGWEVDYVDLDLTGSVPKAEIKVRRHDGRWLWARVDQLGRCTLETFQRETTLGESVCYGKRAPRCNRHDDHFLGRRRPAGPRVMLRDLTNYITDNALHPIALADVRSAWAGVMAAPTRLIALPNGKIT
jgi:hypothetical protein